MCILISARRIVSRQQLNVLLLVNYWRSSVWTKTVCIFHFGWNSEWIVKFSVNKVARKNAIERQHVKRPTETTIVWWTGVIICKFSNGIYWFFLIRKYPQEKKIAEKTGLIHRETAACQWFSCSHFAVVESLWKLFAQLCYLPSPLQPISQRATRFQWAQPSTRLSFRWIPRRCVGNRSDGK